NSVDGSIHQVCMDWRHALEMLDAGRSVYSELKNLCIWNKTNAGMGSFYRSKHELVFVWKSGGAAHINNFELGQHGRHRTNVWDYAGVNTMRAGRLEELEMHPTVKPVALLADAIKNCSRRGGLVLDPFSGSGTILIAAEKTGRKARALEIDPTYVDVAVRRWQAYTGKSAVLAGSATPSRRPRSRGPPNRLPDPVHKYQVLSTFMLKETKYSKLITNAPAAEPRGAVRLRRPSQRNMGSALADRRRRRVGRRGNVETRTG